MWTHIYHDTSLSQFKIVFKIKPWDARHNEMRDTTLDPTKQITVTTLKLYSYNILLPNAEVLDEQITLKENIQRERGVMKPEHNKGIQHLLHDSTLTTLNRCSYPVVLTFIPFLRSNLPELGFELMTFRSIHWDPLCTTPPLKSTKLSAICQLIQ